MSATQYFDMYKYDAFFSYKRDAESNDWHERVKNKLIYWLKQELERQEVTIFFDTEDIPTGARWRNKLAEALQGSRCIVCLWSPLYFQSKWCMSEFLTFQAREELIRKDHPSCDLILPASYFDGETFPDQAASRQFKDFSSFASTMPKFWDTELAVSFENNRLKPFAKELAVMIRAAPDYRADFPLIEAADALVSRRGTIGRFSDI